MKDVNLIEASRIAAEAQRRFWAEGVRLYGDVDDLEEKMELATDDARFIAAKARYLAAASAWASARFSVTPA